MSIDTLKLKAYVDAETAQKVENFCILRQAIEVSTGCLQYEITSGSLNGTYDSRISLKVARDTDYYIIVECSLHKSILGHNVYGGTDDLQTGVAYFHSFIEKLVDVKLPFCCRKWQLMRIDLAEIYMLDSYDACYEWFKSVNSCVFPRRTVKRDGCNGIFSYGSMLGIKAYHKGIEFGKHDRKRLLKIGYDRIDYLQEIADKIIRMEVEIKSRKVKDIYGKYPYIGQVKIDELYGIYDREVFRLLKEGKSDMELVRKKNDVKRRLYNMYNDRLAGVLLGFWYDLTVSGEDSVKRDTKRTTYYRNTGYLKDANISWNGTDVAIVENSLLPVDFSPIRKDKRRVVGECQEMQEKLRPFRVVA